MDVLSILGFTLVVGPVTFGMIFDQESMRIVYHNFKAFPDIPSMAITIGGTLEVMMIPFPAGTFKKIGSHLKIIVKPYQYSPMDSVDQIVNLTIEARMKGLLFLGGKLNEIDEPLLYNSPILVVDSVDSEKVRKAMETELERLDERHALDRRFYEKVASSAPTFSMIGTLIGLILVPGNISDVDILAKGMAVALITASYGSLLANVVYLPMTNRLKARHDGEFLCKQLVMEGALAVQEGGNPKSIEEKLYKLLLASYKKPADKGEKQDGNNNGKKNSKKKGIGKRRRWNKKEIEEQKEQTMVKAEGGQDVTAMIDGQMFEELIKIHAQSAGEVIPSILRADIEIGAPRPQEMAIKDVEHGIPEPAIFVKSRLTPQVAGNIVLVLRQRDMQVFSNELMGVDDLPDPDSVSDDVAMSAAGELMNQMSHVSASSMAEYLGDTMDLSDCQPVLFDGSRDLALIIGEPKDAKVMVVSYIMKVKDMVESELIECISSTVMDSLTEEVQARGAACEKARQEEEEAQKCALIMEQNSAIGQDRFSGTSGGQSPADAGTQKPAYSGAVRGITASGGRFVGMPGSTLQNQSMNGNLSLIMDVPLNVSVGIGKTRRRLKDVLNLSNGTAMELDKQSDASVDIIVNGQLIARGEVVVTDDNFGVRISEIVNTRSTIRNGE